MALLQLKVLSSSAITKMFVMTCLALMLTPVFANGLDISSGPTAEMVSDFRDVPTDIELVDDGGRDEVEALLSESLGPVTRGLTAPKEFRPDSLFHHTEAWFPTVAPLLESEPMKFPASFDFSLIPKKDKSRPFPSKIQTVDKRPKLPRIAILIDDLGYNRHGMESSLALPKEVALAILPSTPFASKTALGAQEQGRVTLLHAPMENQRELKLGPGGLYANMTKQELQSTLNEDIDGLPGIQGVNNHMGSLLTTKQQAMDWVMETLTTRSLFFIDSLTSASSVARKTAENHGLKTTSRDVFLDNIRTEKAIDRQFNRLVKLARRHGSALAIGHPYPETMKYLKRRLQQLEGDGVLLVPLPYVLISPKT